MTDLGTTCLCIDLRSAANALTRAYDEALAPAGLTVPNYFSDRLLIRIRRGLAKTLQCTVSTRSRRSKLVTTSVALPVTFGACSANQTR